LEEAAGTHEARDEGEVVKLDSLVRLIEAADYMAFREIALQSLSARGFREPALSDGWNDGGTDVRIFQVPPNPLEFAVQITVEKNWKAKLRSDARKIRRKLKLSDMLLISSRRIAETEFSAVADEILRDESVRVQKMDAQAIASLAVTSGFTSEILTALGIEVPSRASDSKPTSIREDVAYAFTFFGSEAEEFRKSIVEQSVISTLFRAQNSISRGNLARTAAAAIALAENQFQLVESAIDRMLQDGRVRKVNENLCLRDDLFAAHQVMIALREIDWLELRRDVHALLNAKTQQRKVSESSVDAVMEALGALVLSTGGTTASALQNTTAHSTMQNQLRTRLRQLHATLDACAVPEGRARDRVLEELAELATESSIGRHLIAGEIFTSLAAMKTPELIRALGAHSDLIVLLDSSVSIPILAGLLYTPTGRHYSLAARHVYEQVQAHGLTMVLPIDYLEETATHLLDAYRNYRAIVLEDPDLRESENAFVSHFTSLRLEGKLRGLSFVEYLKGYGLNVALARGDYFIARNAMVKRLESLFNRYGIATKPLGRATKASEKRAEQAIAFAEHEKNIRRRPVVVRHDSRTIAYLFDQEGTAAEVYILCTWDGLHFYIREAEAANAPRWHVADPALLGDTLALAAPSDGPVEIVSPTVMAMLMSDATARQGAYIWDVLAQIEKDNLHDAQLLTQAHEFKEHYLRRTADAELGDITAAWSKWKEEHQIELFSEAEGGGDEIT
jgi:hypothetical protein